MIFVSHSCNIGNESIQLKRWNKIRIIYLDGGIAYFLYLCIAIIANI